MDILCERDVVAELRIGKMRPMYDLKIESGIDKKAISGPVWVGKNGIEDDEHDLTFHGGPTKAVHAYSRSHYPNWQSEYSASPSATRFVPGAFGENLVVQHFNERNICVGDIFAVGGAENPLLLQISQPRQPCFKLNHRFQLKNFAPETTRLSRTGWYYRVLREGSIRQGDEIKLVERKYPAWTLERLQHYLYREKDNVESMQQLLEIEELTDEIKGTLKRNLTKAQPKPSKSPTRWAPYRIIQKSRETSLITSFVFESLSPIRPLQVPSEGSHIKIRLPNNLVRAYSIVHSTATTFTLGIAFSATSRGGSKYLHEVVRVGDVLDVGTITPGIQHNSMASNHVFIVAGVGITAFLLLVEAMVNVNWSVQVHYAVKSREAIPFKERIEKLGASIIVYDKAEGKRLNVENVISSMPWNSSVYVCGPQSLMMDARAATQAAGLSDEDVHFEVFEADVGGDPFEAVVSHCGSRKAIVVKEEETLLEVLLREFEDGTVGSSCEVGNCGTCRVRVLGGEVEHRGTALSKQEKKGEMLSCVSRGKGRIEIELGE